MILLVHMLFGAATGSVIKNPYLAIILALFGHYFLDLFPHIEYSVDNIRNKIWKKSFPDFLKIALDIIFGLLIILFFSNNNPLIYICAIVALIPDSLTLINKILPNAVLSWHDDTHTKKIHFLKYKKISIFWRILTQVIVVCLSVFLLTLR